MIYHYHSYLYHSEKRKRERQRLFLFWCNFFKNPTIKRNLRSYRYFLHFLHLFSFFLSFMSDLVTVELTHLHEYKGGICSFPQTEFTPRHNFFWFLQQYVHFVLFWTLDGNSWETGFYSRFVLGTEIQRSVKTNGTQLGPTDAQTVVLHLDSYSNLFLKLLDFWQFHSVYHCTPYYGFAVYNFLSKRVGENSYLSSWLKLRSKVLVSRAIITYPICSP